MYASANQDYFLSPYLLSCGIDTRQRAVLWIFRAQEALVLAAGGGGHAGFVPSLLLGKADCSEFIF